MRKFPMKKLILVALTISLVLLACPSPLSKLDQNDISEPVFQGIRGKVSIDGLSDISNVLITAEMIVSGKTKIVVNKIEGITEGARDFNEGIYYTLTDAQGNYTIDNMVEGVYTVKASKENTLGAVYQDIVIEPKAATEVNIVLTATGSVSGTVLLGGATTGLHGTFVYAEGTSYLAGTDYDGNYSITGIPIGTYDIVFYHDGYTSAELTGVLVEATLDTSLNTVDLLFIGHTPVINTVTASPLSGQPETNFTLTASAYDEDGDTLSYTWSSSAGAFSSGNTGNPVTWTAPTTVGSYEIAVTVSDGTHIAEGTVIVDVSTEGGAIHLEVDPIYPNDDYVSIQWHYDTINLPYVWGIMANQNYQNEFQEIVIAVLDTGYTDHYDLVANITSDGYDFVSDAWGNDVDGVPGYDSDPHDPGDEVSSYHGTHVAGTIAARTDDSDPESVAGVGWNKLKVMPVRVLGYFGGTTYDIMQGIYYAAGELNDSGTYPANTAKVINMSLGGGSYDQAFHDAIQDAIDKGITVVCGAGNESISPIIYPARYDNTIAISAVDYNKAFASYSNYGSEVDFAAPGADDVGIVENSWVWSTWFNGSSYNIVGMWGTSMATPHAAGVIGLLYSLDPTLIQSEIYSILKNTAEDQGSPGFDPYFGWGLIDSFGAVEQLLINLNLVSETFVRKEPMLVPQQIVPKNLEPLKVKELEIPVSSPQNYASDTIIIRLKPEAIPITKAQGEILASGLTAKYVLSSVKGEHPKFKLVKLAEGQDIQDLIKVLSADPKIEYAQPNYIYKPIR